MDIRGASVKRVGTAPTPTNTPVASAPISSRSSASDKSKSASSSNMGKNRGRKGGRPVDEEEEEEDIEDTAELMSRNPELAAAIEAKLGQLMGNPSSHLKSLSPEVKRRLKGLKNLQVKHSELEAEFREELLKLERAFLEKYKPLYEKRHQIIVGDVEPTDEECEHEDSDVEEATIQELDDNDKPVEAPVKGIPGFWLTAMMNHPMLAEIIQPQDEPALKELRNVTLAFTEDNHGFVLNFEFGENEFFTNKVLTKTYYLQNNVGTEYDDLIYTKAEGTTIDWKKDKNLTVRTETKKQRHKGSKKTRVVKREVPTPSFFNFFSPPKMPSEEEEEVPPELEEQIEQDFELGEMFKTRLIKHAVDWFTGKALEHYDEDGEYGDEDYGEEGEEGEEDEDDDDDDDQATGPVQSGDKPADCQQQ